MGSFWDENGYEIVKFLREIFNWVLGLFGITLSEDLPGEFE